MMTRRREQFSISIAKYSSQPRILLEGNYFSRSPRPTRIIVAVRWTTSTFREEGVAVIFDTLALLLLLPFFLCPSLRQINRKIMPLGTPTTRTQRCPFVPKRTHFPRPREGPKMGLLTLTVCWRPVVRGGPRTSGDIILLKAPFEQMSIVNRRYLCLKTHLNYTLFYLIAIAAQDRDWILPERAGLGCWCWS